MEPYLVNEPERYFRGIAARTTNQAEADQSTAKIPNLWRQFELLEVAKHIPARKNAAYLYGVYTDYASDHTGEYSMLVASEVSDPSQPAPADLVSVAAPAGRYLIFEAFGPMPQAIINTWQQIWQYFTDNHQYERAYTLDYEVHPDRQYLEEAASRMPALFPGPDQIRQTADRVMQQRMTSKIYIAVK